MLESPSGDELFKIQERKLRIRDTMELEHGGSLAIELSDGRVIVEGSIVDHEYEIERDGHKFAEVSKRWLRIRDAYGIEIAPGENDALIVAAAICIDEMAHD